jgi:hypothetical protein
MAEQEALVFFDGLSKNLVVFGQRRPHGDRIRLPPTSRSFDVGEQEGYDA